MSATSNPRVFISAATGEYGALRARLDFHLRRAGYDPEFQEVFPDSSADTVRKLAGLIRGCAILIHIAGHLPGSIADDVAVADLISEIPRAGLLKIHPALRDALGDLSGITYTQWEPYLAFHFGIPVFAYVPADAREGNKISPTFAQAEHMKRLLLARKHPNFFNDEADLTGKILADLHREFPDRPSAHTPNNLPERIGHLFVGRDDFLASLRHKIKTGHPSVITTRQAIRGMGGVGKTRAAIEYAWQNASHYNALLFLTADSPESLTRNLAALCGASVLNLPEQAATDTATQLDAVLRWLANHPGWLLLIDNVDTEPAQRAVRDLIARIPGGHILITTRIADWPAVFTPLDLDVLDTENSIRLLNQHTDGRRTLTATDSADAAEIARHLDGLCLFLEQAAAWVRKDRRTFRDYLTAWEKNFASLLADYHEKWVGDYHKDIPGITRAALAAYNTSIAQLSTDTRRLFDMLCWLAPDPIPVLHVEKIETLPDPRTLLVALADLHLVRLSEDATTATMHRMMQLIGRHQQQGEKPDALIAALNWIDEEMPNETGDVRNWPVAAPLMPHAVTVANTAADHRINEPTARLLSCGGEFFAAKADYASAEPLSRRALEIDEATYGKSHPEVARHLNNLAQLLNATNHMAEAEPLMQRALEIAEATYGKSHPKVAICLNNLAALLQATNRMAEAEPMIRRALEIDEATYGKSHPQVAISLNNLAQLLQDTDRMAEVEPMLVRVSEILENKGGEPHPNYAGALNNLALLLQATNRMAEAEPLYRRALEIDEAVYGKSHPDVAIDLNNLAQLLQATNRMAEAEPLMRRALEIDEATYGKSHPQVAISLNNLAQLLKDTNRMAEAEPMMRRALEIAEATYGKSHPDVATYLNSLARLLKVTNRMAEAEPMMRRALEMDEATYGKSHPNVANCLNSVALLLQDTNRLAEAEPMFRRALEIFEASLGSEHPNTVIVRKNLEILRKEMGK